MPEGKPVTAAEAVRASFDNLEDGGEALASAFDTAFDDEGDVSETAGSSAAGTGEVDEEVSTEEAAEPSEAADIPDNYFGFDLSPFEPEMKAKLFAEFTERDRLIQEAKREAADARKEAQEVAEPAYSAFDPDFISDAEIAEALGLDPEDSFFEVQARTSIPLAREILDLRNQVTELASSYNGERENATWAKEVKQLEQTYGDLPPDMGAADIVAVAHEYGISDPEAAFLKATALRRQVFAETVAKVTQQPAVDIKARKRSAPPAVKPSAQKAVDAPVDLKGLPLREAVRQGILNAEKKVGVRLDQAAQRAGGV